MPSVLSTALGLRPRAVLKTSGTVFLNTDRPRPANNIYIYFSELKTLYNHDNMGETTLFNNKDILIGGKPFFNKEWFSRRIISITDLLDAEGRFLSLNDF